MGVICLLCILFLFALADIKKRCIPTWGAVLYWLLGAVLYGCMWTERGWAPLIDGFVVIALCGAIKKIFPKDVGPGDLVLLAGLFLYTSGQMLWRGLGVAFFLNGLAALCLWLIYRDKKAEIPFIPFLWSGFLLAVVIGAQCL